MLLELHIIRLLPDTNKFQKTLSALKYFFAECYLGLHFLVNIHLRKFLSAISKRSLTGKALALGARDCRIVPCRFD